MPATGPYPILSLPYANTPYYPKSPTSGATATAQPGNLSGSVIPGTYNASAGGVPNVPNPITTQGSVLSGNQANLGGLTGLAGQLNAFNTAQAAGQYQANLPLYNQLNQQASSNIASNLAGKLPQDVINQIQQQSAERGITTGSPGGPNSNAAYLSALGLNSLALQNQGQQQFSQAVARTPTGQMLNTSNFLVTPEQQQQAQLAANLYASSPIPIYAQNAAFGALNQGLGRGQQAMGPSGAPTQSQDLVGRILGRYAPTAIGTPSPAAPPANPNAFGVATNSAGGYSDNSGLPSNFDQMSEADQLDWLSGIDTSGMTNTSAPVDTSSYFPDYGTATDLSDPSAFDFIGG